MEIDHYSHLSELRSQLELREEIALDLLRKAKPEKGLRVLDLGCGDACFLSQFKEAGALYGFDLSENQVKKAQQRLPQAQILQGSLSQKIPFEDNFFDIVTCSEVIEHVVGTDLVVREAFRVLKPGGVFLITTPNLLAWYNRILVVAGISPLFVEYSVEDSSVGYGPLKKIKNTTETVGHLRVFHPAAVADLLTKEGFVDVHMKAARFEYLPKWIRWFDQVISEVSVGLGSITLATAYKPQK